MILIYFNVLFIYVLIFRVQPDDIGAHMNVGRTYNNLKKYDEAEAAFWKVSGFYLFIYLSLSRLVKN